MTRTVSNPPEPPALRHIRTVLVIALAGALLWQFGVLLMVVFAGILLAVALNAPARLLARHMPLSYGWSLLVVILLLAALAGGGGWLLAPDIAAQVDEMRGRIPQLIEAGRNRLEQYQWGRDLLQVNPGAGEIASSRRLWSGLSGAFSTTFSTVANFALILFLGLYLAAQPGVYQRGIVFIAPDRHRARVRELLDECGRVLRHWLFGTMLSMLVIGLFTWVGLTLLGVPLALSLALIAALLAFIPNIGPVLAAIPAVLLSLLESPQLALYVALLYIGVQTVESYLITPFIQRRAVSLPPALTIGAQFLLGMLAGGFGLFVATPLAALGLTVVRRLREPGSNTSADST
jgi:predicted PurR-regulated permease PerM